MSDNWIIAIPEDPECIPDEPRQLQARDWISKLAPQADAVELRASQEIQFVHCGSNFERVVCPSCRSEVPIRWWQQQMDEDYDNGFTLRTHVTPCCGQPHTLADLVYEWPQGFSRFSLAARNPGIGTLDDVHQRELERILGTKLLVIYRHG